MHPFDCDCSLCRAAVDELLDMEPEDLEVHITDQGDVVEVERKPRTWYWDGTAHISRW